MKVKSGANFYRFGRFVADPAAGTLSADGVVVSLRPKSFAVLCLLAENAGRLMSKAVIAEAVWGTTAVSDESLARCVADIRGAMGNDGRRLVHTVARRGYMLRAPVSASAAPAVALARFEPPVLMEPFDVPNGDGLALEFARGLRDDLAIALGGVGCRVVVGGPEGPARLPPSGPLHRLAGSLRREGGTIRIVARLIDSVDNHQVWAERIDRHLGRTLSLQSEIAERLAAGIFGYLATTITHADDSVLASRHFARGEAALLTLDHDEQHHLGDWLARARSSFARCLELEPDHPSATVEFCQTFDRTYLIPTRDGTFAHEFRKTETLEHALELAEQAVARFPNFPAAHSQLGWVLHWLYRRREGLRAFQRALEIDPDHLDIRFALALSHVGRADEALAYLGRQRVRQSYAVPGASQPGRQLGIARFLAGQYGAAADVHTRYARRKPGYLDAQVWRAIVNGKVGRTAESDKAVANVMEILPTFTIAGFLAFTRLSDSASERAVREGLTRAGLPQ